MECPNCKHHSPLDSKINCLKCSRVYARRDLEEYEHLLYLKNWIDQHQDRLGGEAAALKAEVENCTGLVRRRLGVVPAPALQPAVDTVIPAARPLVEPVVLAAPPVPVKQSVLSQVAASPQPAKPATASPRPVAAHIPAARPQNPLPSINWNKVWDNMVSFVVSGALLRALLYLGAFMIVISAFVLVINFWGIFPPLLQLTFIFSLPTAFYVAGWLVGDRLKLRQAGLVMTGIGALLLAVDFAALYQFGRLKVDISLYWLVASLVTTVPYTFTAYRLKNDFFDYLMLLSIANLLMALARSLQAPLVWTLSMLPLACLGMTGTAAFLSARSTPWRDLVRTARCLPHVLLPISLVAILLVGGLTPHTAKTIAFLLAAAAYGILAWRFPAVRNVYLAIGCLAGAVWLGSITSGWHPAVLALLSAASIFTGVRLFRPGFPFVQAATYRRSFLVSGFTLSLVAFASAVALAWGPIYNLKTALSLVYIQEAAYTLYGLSLILKSAISLTLLGFSYCAWTLLIRKPVLGAVGSTLLFIALLTWLEFVGSEYNLPGYLLLLIGVYLPMQYGFTRLERKLAVPFRWAGWAVSFLTLWFSLFSYGRSDLSSALEATALVSYHLFSAWNFKQVASAWAAAVLFPLAAASWIYFFQLSGDVAYLVWVGLAYAYLFVERFFNLKGAAANFRLPIRLVCFAVALLVWVATLLVFTNNNPSIESPVLPLLSHALLVALVILGARLHHSRWLLYLEPFVAAVFVVLFFNAYAEGLFGSSLTWFQYGFVLSGVGWVHLLAAVMLDAKPTRYAHGLYLGGYFLCGLAVLLSLTSPITLLWTLAAFIVAMFASAVLAHANRYFTWDEVARLLGEPGTRGYRFLHGAFLWLVAWLIPIWCALFLSTLKVIPAFYLLGFSVPALLYLLLGRELAKQEVYYSWSFFIAAHSYAALAVLASLGQSIWCVLNIMAREPMPTLTTLGRQELAGQGVLLLISVVFYAGWAWIKGKRLFTHLAGWISFLSITSLLIALTRLSSSQLVLAWLGWALLLVACGAILDRLPVEKPRYAHGPYLAGYALSLIALIASTGERWLLLVVLGADILLAAASFLAVHFHRHQTFNDFASLFGKPGQGSRRSVDLLFLFFAVYALPIWLLLMEATLGVSPAWQGYTLAVLAPVYIAAALYLRRIQRDYTMPFNSAGYSLTVIGAWLAFSSAPLTIYTLLLDIAVYTASAFIFYQPFWLYLATFLAPITVLITLDYNDLLDTSWIAWSFIGLAFIYFGIGQLLERLKSARPALARLTRSLYIPCFVLSAMTLLITFTGWDLPRIVLNDDLQLALGIYAINILLFALSAWRFRNTAFLYPAAWLAVVPYKVIFTYYLAIPSEWQVLAWLPLILTLLGLGRFVFHRRPLNLNTPLNALKALGHPAMPFYIMGYVLTIAMTITVGLTPLARTVIFALVTAVYLASSLMFRHPAWLYPTLVTTHLTILAYFSINPTSTPIRYITYPFLVLTWLEALVGYFVSRRYPAASVQAALQSTGNQSAAGTRRALSHLLNPSWSQPIFIFVFLDTLAWEGLALSGLDTGVWVSAGFFLLYGLFTFLWQDSLLAYLAIGLATLTCTVQYRVYGFDVSQTLSGLSAVAFVLYLFSWLVEHFHELFGVWRKPLVNSAIVISIISLSATLPESLQDSIPAAAALGFCGALYLTMSLRQRNYSLGYLGMGMLITSWSLFLFVRDISQPQFYAIPFGLYFTGMGFFERRRQRRRFAQLIESFGLAVLLVTTFLQSLNGAAGFSYFLILLVESLLIVWWGAAQRLRIPFTLGLIASVMNVLAQMVVLVRVYDVNRWIIIFGVGILLISLGIFVERRRETLLARAQDFREMLETWI